MPKLLPIELSEDSAPLFFAVEIAEHVQRLDNAAKFGEGAGQRGRAVADLQDAHDGTGMDAAKLERFG